MVVVLVRLVEEVAVVVSKGVHGAGGEHVLLEALVAGELLADDEVVGRVHDGGLAAGEVHGGVVAHGLLEVVVVDGFSFFVGGEDARVVKGGEADAEKGLDRGVGFLGGVDLVDDGRVEDEEVAGWDDDVASGVVSGVAGLRLQLGVEVRVLRLADGGEPAGALYRAVGVCSGDGGEVLVGVVEVDPPARPEVALSAEGGGVSVPRFGRRRLPPRADHCAVRPAPDFYWGVERHFEEVGVFPEEGVVFQIGHVVELSEERVVEEGGRAAEGGGAAGVAALRVDLVERGVVDEFWKGLDRGIQVLAFNVLVGQHHDPPAGMEELREGVGRHHFFIIILVLCVFSDDLPKKNSNPPCNCPLGVFECSFDGEIFFYVIFVFF